MLDFPDRALIFTGVISNGEIHKQAHSYRADNYPACGAHALPPLLACSIGRSRAGRHDPTMAADAVDVDLDVDPTVVMQRGVDAASVDAGLGDDRNECASTG